MRYRQVSYRYAIVLTSRQPRPLGEVGRAEARGARLAQLHWSPSTDVYETDTTVVVTVELAGVDLEDLDAVFYEDAVIIEGQRRLPPAEAVGRYHAAEIRRGPFRLEVALPAPVDPAGLGTNYDRGLLQLTFPKAGVIRHGH